MGAVQHSLAPGSKWNDLHYFARYKKAWLNTRWPFALFICLTTYLFTQAEVTQHIYPGTPTRQADGLGPFRVASFSPATGRRSRQARHHSPAKARRLGFVGRPGLVSHPDCAVFLESFLTPLELFSTHAPPRVAHIRFLSQAWSEPGPAYYLVLTPKRTN